jgi:hypothetical protein
MAESRTRRRIRKAVEMSGFCGGWTVTTDAPLKEHTNYGDEFCGLSVEEVLADIDCDLWRTPPCGCYPEDDEPFRHPLNSRIQHPLHEPDCRWFIAYRLPWWTR